MYKMAYKLDTIAKWFYIVFAVLRTVSMLMQALPKKNRIKKGE